jgi:hypothetical protein
MASLYFWLIPESGKNFDTVFLVLCLKGFGGPPAPVALWCSPLFALDQLDRSTVLCNGRSPHG